MVEDVGGLLGDALVGLLARGARDLLGLLVDLLADQRRVVEQLDGVGALRALARRARAACARAPAAPRAAPAARSSPREEAGALAGVAGRAGRLDEREQRVAVAVVAQRAHASGCCPRVAPLCHSSPRERLPEVELAGLARALQRLARSCRRASAPRPCVQSWMTHGHQAALVEGDLHALIEAARLRRRRRRPARRPAARRSRARRTRGRPAQVPAERAVDERPGGR